LVKPCETCHGVGVVLSDDIVVRKLVNKLDLLKKHTNKMSFDIVVSRRLGDILLKKIDKQTSYLDHMMSLLEVTVYVEISDNLTGHEFQTSGQ
jgi:Ribonuclease G/E